MVASDYRDVVFEAIYNAAGLHTPGAGMAYVVPIEKMATYIPRELLERAAAREGSR
jgi:hypothetical protein